MNNLTKTLLASSVLMTVAAFSNQASATTIANINLGSSTSISLQDVSAETVVTAAGQTLEGIGHITAINNGFNFANPGYELNFTYNAPVAFDNGGIIIFTSPANLQFWVNSTNTYTTALSSGSMSAATTAIAGGTDFLDLLGKTVTTLAPYNVSGAPLTGDFFGSGTDLSGSNPNGSGVGYFDVVTSGAGLANSFFDTNSLIFNGVTPYDFLFTSTFSVSANNPTWAPVQDASTFTGASVPEPGSLALLGLGLTVLAYARRRNIKA